MSRESSPIPPAVRLLVWISLLALTAGVMLAYHAVSNRPRSSAASAPASAESINELVEQALERDAKSITRSRQRIAASQSATFVENHLAKVPSFDNRFDLLDHSLGQVDWAREGLVAEFGVFSGSTINHIAAMIPNTVHGFDSFEGLPEDWRTGFEEGTFDMDGLPAVADNVELHKGWFDESVPVWSESHPGPLLFIHLDADLYSSTKTVLDVLGDRIVPGTVLQFDEFFNYPGWKQGEFKAFFELIDARGVEFEYIGYVTGDNAEQVAVRILSTTRLQ